MDVCVYSVFMLSCVGSGPATGWSPVQGVLPIVCKIKEPHKEEAKARYGLQRHWKKKNNKKISNSVYPTLLRSISGANSSHYGCALRYSWPHILHFRFSFMLNFAMLNSFKKYQPFL
jgi:hypothetical protein